MIKYLKRTLLVLVALVMSGLAMTSCGDDEDGQDTYKIVPVIMDKGNLSERQISNLTQNCTVNQKDLGLSSEQNVLAFYNNFTSQYDQLFLQILDGYKIDGEICVSAVDIQLQNSKEEVIRHHYIYSSAYKK